jgi:hypothetical protein
MTIRLNEGTEYSHEVSLPKGESIFLAGGITGCQNWQDKVINALCGFGDITICNPRRNTWATDAPADEVRRQIFWEYTYLQSVSQVLFWFSNVNSAAHHSLRVGQESGGNPEAFSQSGAVGLMQIMPRDGIAASFQCSNGPCFNNRPSIDELKDPQFNLKYGTSMLKGLVVKHGDLREALRSYGPMDVGYTYADRVINLFADYKQ